MHLCPFIALCFLCFGLVHVESSENKRLGIGSDFNLHLDRLDRENATSFLENHALRLDFSDMTLSVGKALKKDALELGLYMNGKEEGRKNKLGEVLIPTIIGFKATGLTALFLTAVAVLVFKALAVAKLGILVTLGMLIAKHLHHKHERPQTEVETAPIFYPYHSEILSASAAAGYNQHPASNYLAYATYGLSGPEVAETSGQYAIVAGPPNNLTTSATAANKRNDFMRRKSPPIPILSIKKYTYEN